MPMLIIDIVYKSQCPVQEWIPRFLIVQDAVTCFSIVLISLCILMMLNKWAKTMNDFALVVYSKNYLHLPGSLPVLFAHLVLKIAFNLTIHKIKTTVMARSVPICICHADLVLHHDVSTLLL
jgi:hypothetical protein